MPRAEDIQLLVLAVAAGVAAASVGAWRSTDRRVGGLAVAGAGVLAWWADRSFVHAVPRDLPDGAGPWVACGLAAVAVAWGASRLPVAPTAGVPPVLPLALASLAGVWVGVPETSAAILAAGVLLGVGLVLVLRGAVVSRGAAVLVAVAPVVAATIGAAGERHALAGGLLCSATFVAVGVGGTVRSVRLSALAPATAVHLVAALVAGRQVGVARDWDGVVVAVVLVAALSAVAAARLRQGQEPSGP